MATLRSWWTFDNRMFDIHRVDDTCLPYLKEVTYWHPDYLLFKKVISKSGNIISGS